MSANQDNTITVKLNVGGNHYETSLSTINNSPDSMLAKIVSDRWNPTPEGSNEPIFIDRNGQRFKYVLDYLRDGKVNLPVGENVETFRTELEYFGIDILPDSITSDDDLEMVSLKSRFRNHMKILDDKIEACEHSYVTHLIAKDVVKRAVELQSQNYLESSSESDISSEIVYKEGECNDLVYNFIYNLKKRKSKTAEKECISSINSHTANFKLGIAVEYIKKRVTDVESKKKRRVATDGIGFDEIDAMLYDTHTFGNTKKKTGERKEYLIGLRSADEPLKRTPIGSRKRACAHN